MNLRVYEDKQQLAGAAARDFVDRTNAAIEEKGYFVVALAGGSTPEATYELLATEEYAGEIDWGNVHVFFGDERSVPPDDEHSNYRMADEALLSHVSPGSVHRMPGELDPEEAATAYESELREFFGANGTPAFDLIQLGIGGDGHTASLFPNTPALDVTDRWVTENPVSKLETVRITLTLPVLNAARAVSFLVAGEGKAEALKEVLEGDANPHEYPSKLVQPSGELTWMVDREAAELLDQVS